MPSRVKHQPTVNRAHPAQVTVEIAELSRLLQTEFLCIDAYTGQPISGTDQVPLGEMDRFETLFPTIAAKRKATCIAGEGAVSLWAIPLSAAGDVRPIAVAGFLTDLAPVRRRDLLEVMRCNDDQADQFLKAQPVWPHRGLESFLQTIDRQQADRRRINQLTEETTGLAATVSQSFEELTLLNDLSRQLRLDVNPTVLCENVLKSLTNCIPARTLLAIWGKVDDLNVVQVGATLKPTEIFELYTSVIQKLKSNPLVINSTSDPTKWQNRLIAADINDHGESVGGLFAIGRDDSDEFGTIEANALQSVAGVFGGFIANQRLYSEARHLLQDAIKAFTLAIDSKDPYTCGHSNRVAVMSRVLAQQLGLSEEKVETIYLSGLLHDIGKIGINENVLRKPGRLSDEEFEHIKQHPIMGYRILANIRQFEAFLPGVRNHHEAWDGTGYPDGLVGSQIPREAQIIAVADSIDAMASDRPYRKGMPLQNVEAILLAGRGSQWAADVVDAYFQSRQELWQEVDNLQPQTIVNH
jgi:HD-GYP domain-containing protein (c-di-GMP phosphodiesterase class II)